jgi:hypothetical protein
MAITNATRVADFGSGIGTQGAVLQVDNTNNRIGIGTTNPNQMLQVGTAVSVYGNSGIVSATSFYGDGSNITGLANTDFINATQLNVIGVATASSFVGNITGNVTGNATGLTGAPDVDLGNISASGGDLTIRNVTGVAATFTGVLTYEDVTNVDSVGLITARSGIQFGAAGVGGTIRANGDTTLVGVLTATKMVVNENSGFNDADEYLLVKNTGAACNISVVGGTASHSSVNLGDTDDFNIQKIRSGHSDNSLAFFTNNTSRLHLDNAGRIGINTTTFDDAREALRIQSPTGQTGTFLTILSNEGASSQIFFGDNDFNEGRIDYDHSTNTMGLYTNDNERLLVNDAGVVVTGIASDSKGDLRSIPLQDESGGAYVLVAGDAGQCVHAHGSTTQVTVNQNVFSAGDAVSIVNGSSGNITITQGTSMTIRNTADSSTGSKTLASFGMCTLWFSGHNVAYLSGAGLS